MAPKLYGTIMSPPARAVMLCVKAINLELDFVEVDLLKKEHLTLDFLKKNPLHTIPVLEDNGFIIADSHAIMAYLVETYAKDKSLYPADVKRRTRINEILHFDSGTLFARHLRNSLPVILDGLKVIPEENIKTVYEAFGFVETFLQSRKYIAGDNLSIADFSILTTVTNASVFVPLDEVTYPKITLWKNALEKCLPYYNINKVGAEKYRRLIHTLLSKN